MAHRGPGLGRRTLLLRDVRPALLLRSEAGRRSVQPAPRARYRVIALPATIVVDAEGRIARVIQMGGLSRAGLKAILDQLAVDEKKQSPP